MSEPYFQNIPNYQSKKNEEFMSNAQIEHFKIKLNAWKEQLISDAETTITHIQEDSSKVADINDRATLEEEFSLELRTRDRERKLISKIEKTLHIIELGDYGYCRTCGAEISLMRLEARPTADECIDCKTIAERKEI
ncbi:C4-type zinc finger protein, DksA/TraR family [Bathymodiolus thermophilus thioautotrophic gill symbiont]|uniref:RNA polymerase-binding transcription factor DksA n=1 Tax=Bathymodiolus thermophilus thioautotrophic gill symbiont TaxID=2360 RepID=A0A1J5TXH4_9GAMM|nr:RNA polymerase-binding protein DksA [Bathymodiolus thermophilus thioautotrophic gill symbiont]AYQ57084.1 RNA polymerase-binding protein DksA [Bathymodiolus thermophilus thioautotrophic gill symbiont]OIR25504.1 RNA polymerase-binding protein DksA [Bathymodiolus thermophilus thioautotrophic gill symbiont]CAB5497651.1 RNA polymerase-binding transcription factor DksA [Bathymodiolus thermophilus thioautotrophic gill symbiont]CAB5505846.1 RNA polymerase-binding transcription factor DksA [Bathymodi